MLTRIATLIAGLLLATAATAAAAPPTAPVGLASGLGCGAQCIEKALVTPTTTGGSLEVETDTPARFRVWVSDQEPGAIDGEPWVPFPDDYVATWRYGVSRTLTLDGLQAGTLYHIVVSATDHTGRTAYRVGTFRTVDPPPLPPAVHHEPDDLSVTVTFWKVKIVDDGDSGANKGEITLDYLVNGEVIHHNPQRKLKSGATVTPYAPEFSPTIEDVPLLLELRVVGNDCDKWTPFGVGWNCPSEVGADCHENADCASAEATIDLLSLPQQGALPPNYGTDMPAGHDGYLVFETTEHHLKLRVFAYVDVHVED